MRLPNSRYGGGEVSDTLWLVAVILCAVNVALAVRDKDVHAALGWLAAMLYAATGGTR